MNNLLEFAVESHGGLATWNAFSDLELQLSIGGAIWEFKQNPGLLRDVTYNMKTHQEQLTITGFSAPNRRITFVPDRLTLETLDGKVIESRDNPRAAFIGQKAETPWDKLHVAYFSSYALWTYFNSPFLYTLAGFETEEIGPWDENGETWRRLKVIFPSTVASHVKEQVTYFGPDGLMRRHDYTVEILGGATGANYALNYREFQGIMVPTARRIYAYDEKCQRAPDPLLVSIDVAHVKFSGSSERHALPPVSAIRIHGEAA
jgi:hypothetical protein